jgi:N utilization substance protein B
VKVMQALYTLSAIENDVKTDDAQRMLQKHFDNTKELITYFIYFIAQVAAYAEKDAYKRSGKHLPSKEDLHVNVKIAGNEWLWKIKEDQLLKSEWQKGKTDQRIDKELVRKFYSKLADTEEYKHYVASFSRDRKGEKAIIEFIFENLLLPDEIFLSHLEENFSNWDDDGEMVLQIIKNYLARPGSIDFNQFISNDKIQFAKNLLSTVLDKKEHLESFILPKLKNWDAERLAALDMILMKMGIAEFLFFETIPPKVTINEYIDLAKDYSTAQSGQFINGILDNIHKDLVSQGNLHKTEFKKA